MKIVVQNLTKIFPLSARDTSLSLFKALFRKGGVVSGEGRSITAVNDVSFEINEGDRVGVIGRNGAGKTTLLQMMSGLGEPTSGTVEVDGSVHCVMTLGIGIREQCTGRENIYLSGEVDGLSHAQTDEMIDDIIAFTELGQFIDYPVRTYSSGMKTRLAFAMITHIEPEILMIDEALSAGDVRFAYKASEKMKEICDKGKIIVVVSHGLSTIEKMCNRCLWMDHGRVIMDGKPKEVVNAYKDSVHEGEEARMTDRLGRKIRARSFADGMEIVDMWFEDAAGQAKKIFQLGEEATVHLQFRTETRIEHPDIRFAVECLDGIMLIDNYAVEDGAELGAIEGELSIKIPVGPVRFGQNAYEVHVELLDRDREGDAQLLATLDDVIRVDNPNQSYDFPALYHPTEWAVQMPTGTTTLSRLT